MVAAATQYHGGYYRRLMQARRQQSLKLLLRDLGITALFVLPYLLT
jgi:hypothetical protein